MELHTLIINRILLDEGVSLSELEAKAETKGVCLQDLYTALDKVHKDKRIKRTVKGGEIHYTVAPPPKTPVDHFKWVRENYIRPHHCEHQMEYTDCESCKPFPHWDLSWMFLKTKEERDAFMVEMKGRQAVYNKKRYERG
jgi:hypothetical protein